MNPTVRDVSITNSATTAPEGSAVEDLVSEIAGPNGAGNPEGISVPSATTDIEELLLNVKSSVEIPWI